MKNNVNFYYCDVSGIEYDAGEVRALSELIGIETPDFRYAADTVRHVTGLLLAELALNRFPDRSERGQNSGSAGNAGSFRFFKLSQEKNQKPKLSAVSIGSRKDGIGRMPGQKIKGMPYVDFNISHSGDIVICAIADCEVGADIEKQEKDISKVLSHFCSEVERLWLDTHRSLKEQYSLWTLKESFLKCTGEGMKDIRTMPPLADSSGLKSRAGDYELKSLDIAEGYSAALCVKGTAGSISIEEVKAAEIIKFKHGR
ncbi:MAG: 4'-phosphopantetheinyl transferase superfamily protein [Eubacteriales bacterium]|nr:4'-phosphopantetheinyl transferase superfamily protein [Eubacteriales bacterium]